MTRRLTIERSESRSETIRTRLDLSFDDPPFTDISGPTVQPNSRAVVQVPRVDAPATLGETENDV